MPTDVSPPRGPRRRSPSPRRDRERDDRSNRDRPRDEDRRDRDRDRRDDRDRDRGMDRDRGHERRSDRDRDDRGPRLDRDADRARDRDGDRGPGPNDRSRRTPSPPRRSKPKTKELSFYKKSSSSNSMGSFSHRRDPLALDNIEESAKERMERRAMGEVPARFGGTREQGVRNTMSTIAPSGTSGSATRGGGDPLDRMPSKGGDGDRMMAERVAAMGGGAPAGGAAAGPPSGIPTYVNHLHTLLLQVIIRRPRTRATR